MGPAEIIIRMGQGELLPHAVLALAQRADPPSHRRHMRADGQVEALHERRIALPAAGRQHLLARLQRAAHDPVLHADQTPLPLTVVGKMDDPPAPSAMVEVTGPIVFQPVPNTKNFVPVLYQVLVRK